MKIKILGLAAILLLSIALVPSLVADETSVAPEAMADATVLTGEYHWTSREVKGPIEARFKPAGEDMWAVSFHFDWQGKPRVWEGTAKGSLTDGPLAGEVFNANKRRKFVFEGTVDEGVFNGTHAELDDGEPTDTGTIQLTS